MLSSILRSPDQSSPDAVRTALAAIRTHLGMEVAYISEFVGDRSVFREVDAPGLEALIKPGDSRSLDDVYCRHILAGRLPELMCDTSDYDLAMSMPITKAVPIGAHMSVPVRRKDGSVMGMFCCLSPHANRSLNERDLQVMKAFADMTAGQMAERMDAERSLKAKTERIERVLADEAFSLVFQPIYEFGSDRPTGFEILSRFRGAPGRTPDVWFNEAAEVGLGQDLELTILRKALETLQLLPDDVYVSVNASPRTVLDGRLASLLAQVPLRRVVLEVTEHAPVPDYAVLEDSLAALRAQGLRLAIDDAGAGYSGLQHIVRLKPDIIKLDMTLTRGIDADPARQALAAALIFYARMTHCIIIAEGVETRDELDMLRQLGVPRGQGYYLGRPAELPAALTLLAERQKKSA